MKKPFHRSLLLHAVLLLFAIVSLPDFFWRKPEPEFFTVELVKIADKANIKTSEIKGSKPIKDEAPKSNKIEEKKSEPKPEPEKKEQVKPKEEKTKEPSELIKKEQKKQEKPKDKPKTNLKKDKPKAKVKPAKKPAAKKPEDDIKKHNSNKKIKDADSLLNNLAKKEDKIGSEKAVSEDKKKAKGQFDPSQELTIRDVDLIRSQIHEAWIDIPAGAVGAHNLQVVLYIRIAKDGQVEEVKVMDVIDPNDSFMQAFVQSAVRAVYRASPLKNLPVEKYDHWHELQLTFDPRDLLY